MASVAINLPTVPIWSAPIIITGAMLSAAFVTASMGGPSPSLLVLFYVAAAIGPCLTVVFAFAFVEVAKLARVKADSPIPKVIAALRPRLSMLFYPALVLPTFLGGYTATKIALAGLVGFRFDELFANIDAAIFIVDPWRITHSVIGPLGTQAIEFVYVTVWIALLAYVGAFVALFADRRLALTFYTAMLMTWFLGGFLCAYLIPAAGPAFIQYTGLEMRFVGIQMSLLEMRGTESAFLAGPAYLSDGMVSGEAYQGGGISAMPSMHIAACTLYCLAARGTRWFVPAAIFLAVIFVGSVHSGYHYAIDAPVAVMIAWLCWRLSAAINPLADTQRCLPRM